MAYLPIPSADTGLAEGLNMGSAPGTGFAGSPGWGIAGFSFGDCSVMRAVTVLPLDVHSRSGREIHVHGLGICGRRGGLKWGLHGFSIA